MSRKKVKEKCSLGCPKDVKDTKDVKRLGKPKQLCEKCQYNKPEKDLSLCYECSHCFGCHKYTEAKKDGLCQECRTTILSKARENFRAIIESLTVKEISSNAVVITITFHKDIEAVRRTLERKDLAEKYQDKGLAARLGLSNNHDSPFSESFNVLSTALSKISSSQNRIKMTVELSHFRRFGKMISGGHYDYLQGNDSGYLVHILAEYDDSCTIPIIAKMLRSIGFGCHVSNMTIDGFLKEDMPTEEGETKLMNDIKTKVSVEFGPIKM